MGAVTRLMGGFATRQVARVVGGVAAGPTAMAMGIALPYVARALGPAGMVGLAVGGWAVKRAIRRSKERAADAAKDGGSPGRKRPAR